MSIIATLIIPLPLETALVPLEGMFQWGINKSSDFETAVKAVVSAVIVGILGVRLLKEFTLTRLIINAIVAGLAVFILFNINWLQSKVDQEIKAAMIGPIPSVVTGSHGAAPDELGPIDLQAPSAL